jgi:hypothetical protein
MKKIILAIVFVLIALPAWAGNVLIGQVSCTSTPTLIYVGLPNMQTMTIQNYDSSNSVYIAPTKLVTTATAGMILSPGQGWAVQNQYLPWYCITTGATVVVGYTILLY